MHYWAALLSKNNKKICLSPTNIKNRSGYSNLCNIITYSRVGSGTHRLRPRLSWKFFEELANGLILLTGCSKGNIPKLIVDGRSTDAEIELRKYLDWFGGRNVFVELQQNRVYGDTLRNRGLVSLAQENNVGVVASNNVHYHVRDRHQLHDALVSIKNNKTLDTSHIERRPNANFYLKSSYEMSQLFKHYPEAIDNTVAIADRCVFNLKEDLTGYDHMILALIAGDQKCDTQALEKLTGYDGKLLRPDADFVKSKTGYSIGGVSPLGLPPDAKVYVDKSLNRFESPKISP